MVDEPCFSHFFVFGAGLSVVCERIDADATSWCEDSSYLNILWVHQFDKIFHDDVDTILVKVAVISKAEQIKLQAFALHHPHVGNV